MTKNSLQPNTDPFALARELSGKQLIDGAVVAPRSGRTFDNINPATGAVIGQAAEATRRMSTQPFRRPPRRRRRGRSFRRVSAAS